MKNLKKNVWLIGTIVAFIMVTATTRATITTIWSEDFSDVSEWQVIAPHGEGATITSDGNVAALYVDAGSNLGAFGPNKDVSPLVLFDPLNKINYSMGFTVSNLTWSTSYDIALDEFDANTNYVGTVWQTFPSADTSTFIGSTNVSLGLLSFDSGAVFLLPKITVHTGDGGQTVYFDNLDFTVETVPEPSTAVLFIAGLGVFWRVYRKRKAA